MITYFIPQDNVCAAWPKVKEHLLPAIEQSNGRWTQEHVLVGLATGRQSLWAMVRENDGKCVGAATTEIIQYPEKKYLAIHFLGGKDFDTWYPQLLSDLTHHAKHFECNGIECNARFGFWKYFKNDGFNKKSVFYEKEI